MSNPDAPKVPVNWLLVVYDAERLALTVMANVLLCTFECRLLKFTREQSIPNQPLRIHLNASNRANDRFPGGPATKQEEFEIRNLLTACPGNFIQILIGSEGQLPQELHVPIFWRHELAPGSTDLRINPTDQRIGLEHSFHLRGSQISDAEVLSTKVGGVFSVTRQLDKDSPVAELRYCSPWLRLHQTDNLADRTTWSFTAASRGYALILTEMPRQETPSRAQFSIVQVTTNDDQAPTRVDNVNHTECELPSDKQQGQECEFLKHIRDITRLTRVDYPGAQLMVVMARPRTFLRQTDEVQECTQIRCVFSAWHPVHPDLPGTVRVNSDLQEQTITSDFLPGAVQNRRELNVETLKLDLDFGAEIIKRAYGSLDPFICVSLAHLSSQPNPSFMFDGLRKSIIVDTGSRRVILKLKSLPGGM